MKSVSASQIEAFDPETPFGCNRKWYLDRKMPRVEKTDPALINGDAVHQSLERYLKGGLQGELHDFVVNAPGAVPWLEAVRPRVKLIEQWICEVGTDDKPLENGWSDLYLAGVPVHGKIDWVAVKEGYDLELGDHKTTSNIARYAKTPGQLKKSPQMNIYAGALMDNELIKNIFGTNPENFLFTQDFYQTGKRGRKFEPVSVPVVKKEVDFRLAEIENVVEKMKVAEAKATPDEVEPDESKCDIGFGCPHRAYCPRSGVFNMASLLDMFDVSAAPAAPTVPEVPQPVAAPVVTMIAAPTTVGEKPRKLVLQDQSTTPDADLLAEIEARPVPQVMPPDAPSRMAAPVVAAPAPVSVTPAETVEQVSSTPTAPQPAPEGEKRGRGRPPGSKNKPKMPDAAQIAAAQQPAAAPAPAQPVSPTRPAPEPKVEAAAPAKSDEATVKVDRITIRHGAKIGMPNFSSATVEVEYSAIVQHGSVEAANKLVSLACKTAMQAELEMYVKKSKEEVAAANK